MGWLDEFDADGPGWQDSAAAITEEKKLREMMRATREKIATHAKKSVDLSIYDELDEKMLQLKRRDVQLSRLIDECTMEEANKEMKSLRTAVRNSFCDLRDEFIRLKQSESSIE